MLANADSNPDLSPHPKPTSASALIPTRAQRPAGQTASGRPERKRRAASYIGAEPSVEEIEAEFWRIVETPDDVYESLYGQVRRLRGHAQQLLISQQCCADLHNFRN